MAKEAKMEISLSEGDLNRLLLALEWGMSGFNDEFPEGKAELAEMNALHERLTKTKRRLLARKG